MTPLFKSRDQGPGSRNHSTTFLRCGLVLLVLTAGGCGGPPPELDRARMQIRRGELEAARGTLSGLGALGGQPAEDLASLRAEIESMAADRAAFEKDLAALRDQSHESAWDELKRLHAVTEDAWKRERVSHELSDLADRIAASPSRPLVREQSSEPPGVEPDVLTDAAVDRVPTEFEEREEMARVQAAIERARRAPTDSQELDEDDGSGLSSPANHPAVPPVKETAQVAVNTHVELESDELLATEPEARLAFELAPEVPGRMRSALDFAEYELEVAHPDDRQRAADTLRDLYPEDSYFLRRALRVRWDAATTALLDSAELEQLTAIHAKWKELNRRRAAALELIFDSAAYFYPYTFPACPKEKARTYRAVQERVEELTEQVVEIWEDPTSQVVSTEFRGLVEELDWQRTYGQAIGYFPSLPAGLRGWVLWTRIGENEISVRNFSARQADRVALAYDRAVAAYNREWWRQSAKPGFSTMARPTPQEQRQLEITNEYRRMFGVPALAWSPLLQEAARGHSAYMKKVGMVTHTQEGDPSRRSTFDRMALVGYNYGASENCLAGFVLPDSAHRSWRKSSAHHRNLLNPKHTELGAALDETYWTQNFGSGREFQSELDTWQD